MAIVSSVFPAALPLGTPALAGQLLIFETWQGSLVQQGHTAYDWASSGSLTPALPKRDPAQIPSSGTKTLT